MVVVAAHSLVSLTFLHSDEFYQLKLQRNGIFQQTAKSVRASLPQLAPPAVDLTGLFAWWHLACVNLLRGMAGDSLVRHISK